MQAYPFKDERGEPGYWRDVGTLESYWKASMELCSISPQLNLYNPDWPVWTYQAQLPPAKFAFDDVGRRGVAIDSTVASGCILSGARLKRSVLFNGCFLHSYSFVRDSVVLPKVEIGRNCRITKAVIDKACIIPPDTIIGEDRAEDEKRFYVDETGLVLVTPDMLGQHLHPVR
mgnify:FL=1